MATYEITGPDGNTYEVTAPDDASEADVLSYVQRNMSMKPELKVSPVEVGPQDAPAEAPRMGREDMSAYEKYKGSPEDVLQRNPVLSTLRDSVTGIGSGISFNLSDEMQGGLSTPIEAVKGAISGEDSGKSLLDRIKDSYDRGLGRARAGQKEASARSPVATTVGEIAGGTALGGTANQGGLTLLNAAKPTIGSMALRGAGEGAAYGAAYGFGAGEGTDDRLAKGGTGALIGGATGGLTGAVSGKMAQNAANKTIPTADKIQAASRAAFKESDQAGVVISHKSFADKFDDIAVKLHKEGLDKTLHPRATAALVRLEEAARGGTPMLSEINTLRRVVGGAASSPDPSERRLAMIMANKLDDWLVNLKPSDVVAGDAIKGVSALNKAKKLWNQQSKDRLVAEAFDKADLRSAATGSGGNIDNATRQKLYNLLEGKKSSLFTKEEKDAIRQIIKGTTGQNLMRLIGKLSPQGNGLMMTVHAVGGVGSGGASLPLAAVGYGAKKAADKATTSNVDALSRLIRSGGNLPNPQLTALQRKLMQSLLVSGAQQGPGLLDTTP